MSNVCLVPFSYIFLRGQGIKVTSFVSKECDVQKTRMPTLKDYKETTDGYEGAIVLEPKTGIYLDDPIAVLDYASLYPSSIIENNLSQDKYWAYIFMILTTGVYFASETSVPKREAK